MALCVCRCTAQPPSVSSRFPGHSLGLLCRSKVCLPLTPGLRTNGVCRLCLCLFVCLFHENLSFSCEAVSVFLSPLFLSFYLFLFLFLLGVFVSPRDKNDRGLCSDEPSSYPLPCTHLTHTHTHTHIHTHTLTYTHRHAHTHTLIYTHTHTHPHIHTQTHTHTHPHIHTQTHTPSHTHTDTHPHTPYVGHTHSWTH